MDNSPGTTSSAPPSSPFDHRDDTTGRSPQRPRLVIDYSPETRRARNEAMRRAIAAMRAIGDDPDEDNDDFLRELDEANPGRFDLKRHHTDGPDPA